MWGGWPASVCAAGRRFGFSGTELERLARQGTEGCEGGGFDLLQRLGRLYLGPNAVYPPAAMSDIPGWITRITPARFAGVGPWVVPTAHE